MATERITCTKCGRSRPETEFFKLKTGLIYRFTTVCYNYHILYFPSYNRWLCQARSEDLSDIASLKALYQTGELKDMATYSFTD